MDNKTVIIGLGNDILGDDAFGLLVARRLRSTKAADSADILECSASGFRLLDYLEGYDVAIVIDAYLAPDRPFAEVLEFELSAEKGPLPSSGSHFYSFPQALAAGKRMGMRLPETIKTFCVVIHEYAFSEKGISPALEPAAEEILQRVLARL